MTDAYLIIGNGIAGATAAEILRAENSAAMITVIADDPFPVYYRPALKDYLAGRVLENKLWARSTSFYQDSNIRFLPDRVTRIQVGQHLVQLHSGREVSYSRLLLANGANASQLTCPGRDLEGVSTLRTVADYQRVLERLGTTRHIVVSGSGTLALESIETLRHRGCTVTHLLRRQTLWSEVLDQTTSDLVLQQERRDGVDVRLEEEIAEITGKGGQVKAVTTSRGARIACDMVLIAIGVEPIVDFIRESGIGCGRGVKVDSKMRTNAPDIYAAGDVLETTDIVTGRTRVLGQWYPAIQQARASAYSMLDVLDDEQPFRSNTFYNATFLYGLDFASVGLTTGKGYQELIDDPKPRRYRKVLLKDGVIVGMLSLGERKQALAFKRAIDYKVNLQPVAARLFADDFKLNDWLDRQGVPPPILRVQREGDGAIKKATGNTYVGATLLKSQPILEAQLVPLANLTTEVHLSSTHLSQTKVMTVGRQAGVYLLIDHSSISRRHAELSYTNGQYTLRDLGSTNGTFVNNTRLEIGSVYVLKKDDTVRFGNAAQFAFRLLIAGEQGQQLSTKKEGESGTRSTHGITMLHEMQTGIYDPDQQTHAPLGQMVLQPDGSLLLPGAALPVSAALVARLEQAPALVVVGASQDEQWQSPEVYLLKMGKHTTLGRDKKNDIVLADVIVSRKQAEVFPGPEGFYIRDLGSSNGVFVNQTKIDNPYLLSHADRITIGSNTLHFIDLNAQAEAAKAALAPMPPATSISSHAVEALHTCGWCGKENVSIARFCASCGSPLQPNP